MSTNSPRIELLIDADNVAPAHITGILAELRKYGVASVRRMYGDWTTSQLSGWKTAANEHSIQPVQQFAYTKGKNATDSALIIDAMDLLHLNDLDGYAIVSSDSDYTRLAARLRESGGTVYGFGERKTPTAFVRACDVFVYLDILDTDDAEVPAEAPAASANSRKSLQADRALRTLLLKGVNDAADEEGWAHLGGVGSLIQKQSPDFDPRNWGFGKLSELVEAINLFELDRVQATNGGSHMRVRIPRHN